MKNIPYDKDYPLQRVEEGDAVEISVMHFPNKLVRDKDVKKYGHIPDGVYHAVAVAPYKLKCEQHPELSGYYNYWYGDKRGCSDGIGAGASAGPLHKPPAWRPSGHRAAPHAPSTGFRTSAGHRAPR